jgi:hypothetical protein
MDVRDDSLQLPDLMMPVSFRVAPPAVRARICNGAGPSGWGWIVPDTIWGLSITLAADIHDWMYTLGQTEADRRQADLVFFHNMITLINARRTSGFMRTLRELRAIGYYLAVSWFGRWAFWKGKK